MQQWKVEFYESPTGNPVVLEWFQEQDSKVQAKFARIFDLLQEKGTLVGMPYVGSLPEKLYEIRVEQATNIYRIIHFAYSDRRIILLHGFQKKTQKTLKREIDLAEKRRKEFVAAEKLKEPPKEPKDKRKRK